MSGSELPSREELLAVIEAQARTIETLTARVAELERRLGRNSGNSSQPPSADGPAVSPSRAERRRSGRKPGKQPGTGGSTLFQTSDPDEVVDHVPAACSGCGHDLHGAHAAAMVRRQVHDIPSIAPVVTEHRLHRRRCGCGTTTTAAAPAGVGAAAVYGPNLRALAVYLLVFQHIPVVRTQAVIADLTGARPSTGWISSQLSAVADVLGDAEKLIKPLIVAAHVIHVDETVVHDALSVYDAYPQARHALCCAHLTRGLVAAGEADPHQVRPAQALRALHGLNTAPHHARDQQLSAIPPEIADPLLRSWRHALLVGLVEHRRVPGHRQSKTRNLLERLRDRQVLLFARDLNVPFTNNQAERDVRPTRTQLKISGCHRSETTARAWLRISGRISTVRKHGDNVYDALRDAITGKPWKPPPTC